MKNIFLIIIAFLSISIFLSCKNNNPINKKRNVKDSLSIEQQLKNKSLIEFKNCNKKDSLGNKQGLWIEEDKISIIKSYYKDNKRNGVYIKLNKAYGNIQTFGEFCKGEPCSKWFYFDKSDHLWFTLELISTNWDIDYKFDYGMPTDLKIIPICKCYNIEYYPNGIVKSEGMDVCGNDFEVDCEEIGLWKYYNDKGELIKTKIFNPKKVKLTPEEKRNLLIEKNKIKTWE